MVVFAKCQAKVNKALAFFVGKSVGDNISGHFFHCQTDAEGFVGINLVEFTEFSKLLGNRQLWMNPLSDVMGGWGIWETVNGERKLTTECIENVIMMVPFSAVVAWTFGEKIGSGWKKILCYSGKIAFIFSVSIEMLQLLLRLGTFQLSDIFYNTVGGVLGGLMYYIAMKARKRL